MATLLKDIFSPAMVQTLADDIQTHYPQFDQNAFKAAIFDQAWPNLSLKQSLNHITPRLKLLNECDPR